MKLNEKQVNKIKKTKKVKIFFKINNKKCDPLATLVNNIMLI